MANSGGFQRGWTQGSRGAEQQQRYAFDEGAVSRALDAARRAYDDRDQRSAQISTTQSPTLRTIGDCVDLRSGASEVCLDLPLGLGSVCIPLPFDLPDGTAAQACLYICTTWGFPTGVTVRVTVGGFTVADQSFGWGC
jgi:hypothetical protein